MTKRKKKEFSESERVAIWSCHERRCWFCTEPLRLHEVQVDHLIPESLLDDVEKLERILNLYQLPLDFDVNGYENWLPCHSHCNRTKSARILDPNTNEPIGAIAFALHKTRTNAAKAAAAEKTLHNNRKIDKAFGRLMIAIEDGGELTKQDLDKLLRAVNAPVVAHNDELVMIEGGLSFYRADIVSEGPCACERDTCVGKDHKVHCYFWNGLSEWVIAKGLCRQCYDGVIECHICGGSHPRGHRGKKDACIKQHTHYLKGKPEFGLAERIIDSFIAHYPTTQELDLAWPRTERWPISVYTNAIALASANNVSDKLAPMERFLLLLVPQIAASTAAKIAMIGKSAHFSDRAQSIRIKYRKLRAVKDEQIWNFDDSSDAGWAAKHDLFTTLVRATFGCNCTDKMPENELHLGTSIRWRFLASLLQFGAMATLGAKDLDPQILADLADECIDNSSLLQFFNGLSISMNDKSWIVAATCDRPIFDFMTTRISEGLQRDIVEADETREYLVRNHGFRNFRTEAQPRPKLINGNLAYTTPHIRFQISTPRTRKLFMGTSLWQDRTFAYRELFQNALDACRYRQARCKYIGVSYEPIITMRHHKAADGTEYVECEDNGIGMDRYTLENCFSVAGARFTDTESFHEESASWRESGIGFSQNSRFGIGVFSYFLVADMIEIETARYRKSGLGAETRIRVKVPTSGSFFSVIEIDDERAYAEAIQRHREVGDFGVFGVDAGTRVRLTLRLNTSSDEGSAHAEKSPFLIEAIQKHVWYSDVKLVLCDYRGNRAEISPGELAPWLAKKSDVVSGGPGLWWLAPGSAAYSTRDEVKALRCLRTASTPQYGMAGRILVDGIATSIATPGFVLNLSGRETPDITTDRREIMSAIEGLVYDKVVNGIKNVAAVKWASKLLSEIYDWDPHVCALLDSEIGRTQREHGPFFREPADWKPCRWFENESVSFDEDYHKFIYRLWQMALRCSNVPRNDAEALKARGFNGTQISMLMSTPEPIWAALSSFRPTLISSAALQYRLYNHCGNDGVPYYASWLTGMSISDCAAEIQMLCEVLDLGFNAPSSKSGSCCVGGLDAWLLSVGQLSAEHWISRVSSVDVCQFASATGESLGNAYKLYSELAKNLDLESSLNEDVVNSIGYLSSSELLHVSLSRAGFGLYDEELNERDSLIFSAFPRAPRRTRVGSVDAFSRDAASTMERYCRDLREREIFPDARLAEELLAKVQNGESYHAISCARIVSVGLATETPLIQVFKVCEGMMASAGVAPSWPGREHLESLDIHDLEMISSRDYTTEGRRLVDFRFPIEWAPFISRRLKQRHQHIRVSDLWSSFCQTLQALGWRVCITEEQFRHISQLPADLEAFLDYVPHDGSVTVARLIYISIMRRCSIEVTYAGLKNLAFLGVKLPPLDAGYVGIQLGDLLKEKSLVTSGMPNSLGQT